MQDLCGPIIAMAGYDSS